MSPINVLAKLATFKIQILVQCARQSVGRAVLQAQVAHLVLILKIGITVQMIASAKTAFMMTLSIANHAIPAASLVVVPVLMHV